ncbi:MAG TPA: porin [Burkholderiaceae bacterium]|nr:porin [Burkholderiaceae bacterium]
MKKSLIALAVLGAMSGAAVAQSSVTMYGIIDLGLQWNEGGVAQGGTAGPGGPNYKQESAWSIDSSFQSGSRLGVRGAEALGGNWSAVFTAEMGFDASTGMSAQGSRLFGRQIYAGLRHNQFGTIALGRIATSSSGTGDFDLWGAVDPFGTGFGFFGLQATFIPSNSLREDNSVIWASPSWAGFKFAAQYSGNVNGTETAPQQTNTSAYNLGANWTWGPLFLAATYDSINYANVAGSRPNAGNPNQNMLQLGGTFDFKFLKAHAAWASQKNISAAAIADTNGGSFPSAFVPTGVGNWNNNAYMLGVSAPVFGGTVMASYQWSDAKNVINGLAQFEPDYNVWGIGYSYPFSRRTNMYVGYGQRSWDGSIRSTTGSLLSTASQAFDKSQFAVGIRHLF